MVKFLGYACAAVSMTGTGMSINLEGATEAISTIFGQLADDKSIWAYAIAGSSDDDGCLSDQSVIL